MISRTWKPWLAVLLFSILFWKASDVVAGWETGAKAGFDTNLGRSVDNGEGSGFLSAYGSYWKGHAAETRLDWTLGLSLLGNNKEWEEVIKEWVVKVWQDQEEGGTATTIPLLLLEEVISKEMDYGPSFLQV